MELVSRLNQLLVRFLRYLQISFFIPVLVNFTLTPSDSVFLNILHLVPKCLILKISPWRDNLTVQIVIESAILLIQLVPNCSIITIIHPIQDRSTKDHSYRKNDNLDTPSILLANAPRFLFWGTFVLRFILLIVCALSYLREPGLVSLVGVRGPGSRVARESGRLCVDWGVDGGRVAGWRRVGGRRSVGGWCGWMVVLLGYHMRVGVNVIWKCRFTKKGWNLYLGSSSFQSICLVVLGILIGDPWWCNTILHRH